MIDTKLVLMIRLWTGTGTGIAVSAEGTAFDRVRSRAMDSITCEVFYG